MRAASISSTRVGAADDAGIVDEPGERAEPVGGGEDVLDVGLVGDVAADGDGLAAGGVDLRADALRRPSTLSA